jgi:hypothetical protein
MGIAAPLESAKNPVYQVITREDLLYAFRAAMELALAETIAKIDNLISVVSSTQPSSLWTWGYTSRWGYDTWG